MSDASKKIPKTIYILNTAWEGWEAEAERTKRSVSYLMDEYGLKLRDKVIGQVERNVTKLKLEGFQDFWKLYPKKVAKGDAERAWAKIKAEDREMVIRRLKDFRFPREVKFIPYPATWLNSRRYLDDPVADLPLATQPSRTDWEAAPEHIRVIHKKIMDQVPLSDVETELIGDFMESL